MRKMIMVLAVGAGVLILAPAVAHADPWQDFVQNPSQATYVKCAEELHVAVSQKDLDPAQ